MPALPLVGAAYQARSQSFDAQRCVNLFPELSGSGTSRNVAMLLGTPGLAAWGTYGGGPIRAVLRFSATQLIVVSGIAVYSVTTAGVGTLLAGSISLGTAPVSLASNGSVVMVVTGTANGYFIDPAALTVTQIIDPDFLGGVSVGFIDGYFMWNVPGTGKFQISQLYGTGIDALEFATAEGSTDNLNSLIINYREAWLFGENSTEVWYNDGNLDFPFSRIQGAFLEVGCAAANSPAKMDNTVYWLGADDRGFGTVMRATGYAPQRVSTHAIEFAIANYARIDDAVGYTYVQEGHSFYVLSFPTGNATWVYDAACDLWHERAFRKPDNSLNRHRSNCQTSFAGLTLVGDWQTGALYSMDLDVFSDVGSVIPRIRAAAYVTNDDNTWQVFDAVEIDMQTGVGLSGGAAPVVVLQWSDDDGATWSNEVTTTASAGAIGETQKRVRFNRLGKARARIFRVTITDPVRVALVGASVRARRLAA